MAVQVLPKSRSIPLLPAPLECEGIYDVVSRTDYNKSSVASQYHTTTDDVEQWTKFTYAGGFITGLLLQNMVTARKFETTKPLDLYAIQNVAFRERSYNVARVSTLDLLSATASRATTDKTLEHIEAITKRPSVGRELVIAHGLASIDSDGARQRAELVIDELKNAPFDNYRIAILTGGIVVPQEVATA